MKNDESIREARAEMEAAKKQSERQFSGEQRLPRRFRIYDKIKENVSLKTVDTVIAVTALAIVALLIYGILTGKRG
ncbi:MAG: hypothetical protein E7325_00240 [Clostridiales bacterium]|nr:hypothetical protein [Clostridiales bacterium]